MFYYCYYSCTRSHVNAFTPSSAHCIPYIHGCILVFRGYRVSCCVCLFITMSSALFAKLQGCFQRFDGLVASLSSANETVSCDWKSPLIFMSNGRKTSVWVNGPQTSYGLEIYLIILMVAVILAISGFFSSFYSGSDEIGVSWSAAFVYARLMPVALF